MRLQLRRGASVVPRAAGGGVRSESTLRAEVRRPRVATARLRWRGAAQITRRGSRCRGGPGSQARSSTRFF